MIFIDIDMPEDCIHCPLRLSDEDAVDVSLPEHNCFILCEEVPFREGIRHQDCPLHKPRTQREIRALMNELDAKRFEKELEKFTIKKGKR